MRHDGYRRATGQVGFWGVTRAALVLALAWGSVPVATDASAAESPKDRATQPKAPAADAPKADAGATIVPEPLRDIGRKNKVRLVYFVPRDRQPTANHRDKITVLMTFVNDLYARDLRSKGYRTAGLDFEFEGARPVVHLIAGKENASHYNGEPNYDGQQQWRLIIPEVEAQLGKAWENLYVIFTETYTDAPTKFEWAGGFALGARFSTTGGVGMFSAWILQDRFCATTVAGQMRLLGDETPIEGRKALHRMQANSPRFEFIEDGFGAVAHELGHAFGLPHDLRVDHIDIMGNGFRCLRENYLNVKSPGPKVGFLTEDARMFRWSRFLADDADLADREPPRAVIEHATKLGAGTKVVYLSGEITDDRDLAAVLFWSPKLDWILGGSDLVGPKVRLSHALIVPPLEKGPFEIVVLVIDKGGNIATAKIKIEVE